MHRRYSFTLLEVMIALVLMGVLLSALLGIYRHIVVRNKELAILTEEIAERELIRKKLQFLFIHLSLESQKNSSSFYLGKEEGQDALCILYDNGKDYETAFSGIVEGRIYAKDKKLFCKTKGVNGLVRNEILARDIRALSFSFFDQKSAPQAVWVAEWKENKTYVPAMIKMVLDRTEFVFFPSVSFQPIDFLSG